MRLFTRLAGLGLALLVMAGCQTVPQHKVHYSLLGETPSPAGDVIVLPMDIKVKEMSAAGIQDEVPDWTRQASGNFEQALAASGPDTLSGLKLRDLPGLTPEEQQILDQHVALAHAVTGNAFLFANSPVEAWRHKAKHFDYSIGPGLAFLADKTGADKALILVGEDVHSSSGRKAAFVVAAAFGVGIPMGHTVAVATLVDLRTGNVLWMNHYISVGSTSFMERNDTDAVVGDLFAKYPGIDEYKQFVQAK